MKDLKTTLLWISGAIYVVPISVQLAGVQPVGNLLSLLEVSSLLVLTLMSVHILKCSFTHSNIKVIQKLKVYLLVLINLIAGKTYLFVFVALQDLNGLNCKEICCYFFFKQILYAAIHSSLKCNWLFLSF